MINTSDKMYHIQCAKGDVGRYVLLPGDPFRTDSVSYTHLDVYKRQVYSVVVVLTFRYSRRGMH